MPLPTPSMPIDYYQCLPPYEMRHFFLQLWHVLPDWADSPPMRSRIPHLTLGGSGGINNCQGGLNFFPMKFPKFSLFLINQWGNESAAIVRLTNFTNPRFSTVELKIHAKREIHCLLACMSFSEGVNWEGFLYQIGGKVFVSSLATLLMTAVIVRRGGLNASAQSVQKRALPVKRGIKSTLAD